MNVIEPGPGSNYTYDDGLKVYWVDDIEVRGRENNDWFFHAGRDMPRPFSRVRIGIHQTVVEKLIRETAELDSLTLEYSETEGGNYHWFKDATVINLRPRG